MAAGDCSKCGHCTLESGCVGLHTHASADIAHAVILNTLLVNEETRVKILLLLDSHMVCPPGPGSSGSTACAWFTTPKPHSLPSSVEGSNQIKVGLGG